MTPGPIEDDNYIVCPYCDYEHDADGVSEYNQDFDCLGCGKVFHLSVIETRTYCTSAIEKGAA